MGDCYLVCGCTAYEQPDLICVFTAEQDAVEFCRMCNEHHKLKPPIPDDLRTELEDDLYIKIATKWERKKFAWLRKHPAGREVEHVNGFEIATLPLHDTLVSKTTA